MHSLVVAYENTSLSLNYFKENFREMANQFKETDVDFFAIENAYSGSLTLPYANDALVLTRTILPHPFNSRLVVDGVGVRQRHLGVVSYQASFRQTLFLFAHELGHLHGLAHCENKCVMGIKGGSYVWKKLSVRKKVDHRILCSDCRQSLRLV